MKKTTSQELRISNPEMEAQLATYKEALKEFSEKKQSGKTNIDQVENLMIIYRIAKWLNGLAWFFFIWVFVSKLKIWPIQLIELSILITIFIPLVTIYFSIRYKGFFTIDANKGKLEYFPNILFALIFPSFSLGLHWLFTGFYIINTYEIWLYASIISILIMFFIFYACRDDAFAGIMSYLEALLLSVFMLGYGYGTVAYINLYCDRSEAKGFSVEVLTKEVSMGENNLDHITLAPWGEYQEAQKIKVKRYIFKGTKEGEKISVYLKEGYWGIQYYELSLNQ